MKSFRALFLLAGTAAVCASGQTSFTTGQAARLIIGQRNFYLWRLRRFTNQLIGSPAGVAHANGIFVGNRFQPARVPRLITAFRVLRFSDVSTYPVAYGSSGCRRGYVWRMHRGLASLVLGQPDFTTTNQNLAANGMRNPTGVATDGTVLAVADTDNNRVLIWLSLPHSNDQPADVVIGQASFTTNATAVPPTQTSLRGPEGVWINQGRLFIADTQDNRVLIYNKIPTSNNAPADVVVGQSSFTAFVQPDLTASQPSTAAGHSEQYADSRGCREHRWHAPVCGRSRPEPGPHLQSHSDGEWRVRRRRAGSAGPRVFSGKQLLYSHQRHTRCR